MKRKKPAFICLQSNNLFPHEKFEKDAECINMPKKMFCKHITLCFKPSAEDKDFYYPYLGEEIRVEFGELVISQLVCCYIVEWNVLNAVHEPHLSSYRIDLADLYRGDSQPHLTVATAEPHSPNISNAAITGGIPGMFTSVRTKGSKTGMIFTLTIKAAIYGKDGIEYVTDRELLK